MALLLQCSFRYSYRRRLWRFCPTILLELVFSMNILAVLVLSRFGANHLDRLIGGKNGTKTVTKEQSCSQKLNEPFISSTQTLAECFEFPPSYYGQFSENRTSRKTNLVFRPQSYDVNELVKQANDRLSAMGCINTHASVQDADDQRDIQLLGNLDPNTILVDFTGTADIKHGRNLAYKMTVRQAEVVLNSAPIDLSFILMGHPTVIGDRSNVPSSRDSRESELPEFTNVKIFVDSLLVGYQSNRSIRMELERKAMTCTAFRNDLLFTNPSNFGTTILIFIDTVFIIPYLLLLTTLIHEKNAKVKEILKILGIEPILSNLAHAIRTMLISMMIVILLCVVYKFKLRPTAYFNHVHFLTLLLGNLAYALQLVSFCVMHAQLFDVNVRAIVTTFVIYSVAIFLFSRIIVWPVGMQYFFIFVCPFIGGRSLFQQAILIDVAGHGLDFFRPAYRHVPIYSVTLLVMLCSCLFFWALSWYLEKVLPGEFGIPLDWNFLFKRDYWRSEAIDNHNTSFSDHSMLRSKTDIASVKNNAAGQAVVRVQHLVKKFGPDKIAVNDVSFDLYENQITSLLGPNGSGKTTIFNCLTGMYRQTSGTITMENEQGVDHDTRNSIEELRKSIGYCPQHDILFDLLTIEEQLEFYATARGFRKNKKQIANEMLALVNLEASRNVYCNSLSGGMKRRLSLACAFVGDTKIVLLDEPSSGLDPSNRRLLWDWLRSMKAGKTLLLTTHFMEESDALSDRIMIIANGVIKADGTSAKLKEDYGSGYKLVINRQANDRSNAIESELRRYLPQLKIESDIPGGDVVFRTNQQPNEQFVQALRRLEALKDSNQIKAYGVQNSTMDDVFLKITRDSKLGDEHGSTSVDIERIDEQCRYVFDDTGFYEGGRYYANQLYGLLIKTLRVRYRRWALTLLVIVLPIAYNLYANASSGSDNANGIFRMQPNTLNPQTVLYQTDPLMDRYFQAAIAPKPKGVVLERRSEDISDMNQYIWQKRNNRPYTYTDIYLAFQVPAPTGDTYKMQALSSNLISGYEVFSVASDTFFKHASNDSSASIETTLIYKKTGNMTVSLENIGSMLGSLYCTFKMLPLPLIQDILLLYLIVFYSAIFVISERKDRFLSLLNVSGLHPALYWLFTYLFDIILSVFWFCYLLGVYCLIDIAFHGTRNARSSSKDTMEFEFASPWDLRVQFYPLSIIVLVPTLPFVYLVSKVFKADILGGLAISAMLLLLHVISMIVSLLMILVKNKKLRNLLHMLLNILAPNINAQAIIVDVLTKRSPLCKQLYSLAVPDKPGSLGIVALENVDVAWNWVILILHVVFYLLLLIAIDGGLLKCSCSCAAESDFDDTKIDDDVLKERERILQLHRVPSNENALETDENEAEQETDHLIVHDLVKHFSGRPTPAVNHLTFGAKRGEAFGLLGYNGAGKTTTFKILVGDETPTQGTAFIDGQNIHHRLRSIRRLGYCPQQDCSMEFLTVQDGLYLLARVRGVPFSRIQSVVTTISSLFLLDPFLHNYIHQLSGGTKRRLHAALALIGPPLVAILDEPTTGVDPNARQQMQEIFLNAVKAKLTIILTSHSMDECERVCNRLGIMVSGQLACLGTIQHLKSKFGDGYTIEIKVRSIPGDANATAIQNVRDFLLSQTQLQVLVREITHSTGSFQIGKGTPADLFEILEQNRQQLNIETYTISQTTLEQIFLSFGK